MPDDAPTLRTAGDGRWRRFRLRLIGPSSFASQYIQVVVPYWNSERKWHVRLLALGFVLLTTALVLVVVGINFWNARLFNALQERSLSRFVALLGVFALLLLANVVINVLVLRVQRRLQIEWREWLTNRLLGAWMAAGRHYQLTHVMGEHDNPDGRIAEDIRVVTQDAIQLTYSLLYNALQLVSFVNILWLLSGIVHLRIGGMTIPIPGHMVWIALAYALAGSALAVWIGRPLVGATNRRQTKEANFRFGLVRARENSEAIALIRGEADERQRLRTLFADLKGAWDQQSSGLARILMFTTANSMLSTPFPLMIEAPRYIMNLITLGTLMQTAQAFQLVTSALSWPVDNLAQLAEWRASADRVLALHADLAALDRRDDGIGTDRIRLQTGPTETLALDALSIGAPDAAPAMVPVSAAINRGDHVLITGEPELVERLPKVIAGLWPWGRGRVSLPAAGAIFFMPEQPYLPIGSLRDAVCYPRVAGECDPAMVQAALVAVGLGHLQPRLDDGGALEPLLTRSERQRLGFARLLLQLPDWIFLSDAMSALDAAERDSLLALLRTAFAGAAVVYIGSAGGTELPTIRRIAFARQSPPPAAAQAAIAVPTPPAATQTSPAEPAATP